MSLAHSVSWTSHIYEFHILQVNLKKLTILTKLKLIRDFMTLVPRRMRDYSGAGACPDESVFTDSV